MKILRFPLAVVATFLLLVLGLAHPKPSLNEMELNIVTSEIESWQVVAGPAKVIDSYPHGNLSRKQGLLVVSRKEETIVNTKLVVPSEGKYFVHLRAASLVPMSQACQFSITQAGKKNELTTAAGTFWGSFEPRFLSFGEVQLKQGDADLEMKLKLPVGANRLECLLDVLVLHKQTWKTPTTWEELPQLGSAPLITVTYKGNIANIQPSSCKSSYHILTGEPESNAEATWKYGTEILRKESITFDKRGDFGFIVDADWPTTKKIRFASEEQAALKAYLGSLPPKEKHQLPGSVLGLFETRVTPDANPTLKEVFGHFGLSEERRQSVVHWENPNDIHKALPVADVRFASFGLQNFGQQAETIQTVTGLRKKAEEHNADLKLADAGLQFLNDGAHSSWLRKGPFTAAWLNHTSLSQGDTCSESIGYDLILARNANEEAHPVLFEIDPTTTTPANLKRSFVTALTHGAKSIHLQSAGLPAAGRTGIASHQTEAWQALLDISRMAAFVQPVIGNAKPRDGDVGLLLTNFEEPWCRAERKALYIALRQSGHTIRFLTEGDVQNEKWGSIVCLMCVGSKMEKATADKLQAWVKKGGSMSITGGSFQNEKGQPLTGLLETAGLKEATWKPYESDPLSPSALACYESHDTVKWDFAGKKRDIPVLLGRTDCTPLARARLDVFGKYNNGNTAVIRTFYGLGQCWFYGSPIGTSFLRDGLLQELKAGKSLLTRQPNIPADLDGEVSELAVAITSDAFFQVITDKPLIENIVMEGPQGVILGLVNWSGEPQTAFITIQNMPKTNDEVTGFYAGKLKATRIKTTISFKVKVDATELIIIK